MMERNSIPEATIADFLTVDYENGPWRNLNRGAKQLREESKMSRDSGIAFGTMISLAVVLRC